MKLLKAIVFMLLVISSFSCEKEDDLPEDDIKYTPINKMISELELDSINGTCRDLIFEIRKLGQDEYSAYIIERDDMIACDGFNNILINTSRDHVIPLDGNQVISDSPQWDFPIEICLDKFAGEGEKYIGYRSGFFPSGDVNFRYGWIKIELSSDKKKLTLIERATNMTVNTQIKAGQKE